MELSADVFGCGGAVYWQGELDDLSWEPSEVTGLRRPGKKVILAALKTAATPPNHLHMVLLKDAKLFCLQDWTQAFTDRNICIPMKTF